VNMLMDVHGGRKRREGGRNQIHVVGQDRCLGDHPSTSKLTYFTLYSTIQLIFQQYIQGIDTTWQALVNTRPNGSQ